LLLGYYHAPYRGAWPHRWPLGTPIPSDLQRPNLAR